MSENESKWICAISVDTEVWSASDYFDTRDEAIQAGRKALTELAESIEENSDMSDVFGCFWLFLAVFGCYWEEEYIPTTFAIGQLISPSLYIDGGSIIENLQDQTYSECGEFAEGFLDDVSKEEEEEVSERLNYVLNEWINKYNYRPEFYNIYRIEKINVGEEK